MFKINKQLALFVLLVALGGSVAPAYASDDDSSGGDSDSGDSDGSRDSDNSGSGSDGSGSDDGDRDEDRDNDREDRRDSDREDGQDNNRGSGRDPLGSNQRGRSHDQENAIKAVRNGRAVSLQRLKSFLDTNYPGSILGVELSRRSGEYYFDVRILTKGNRIKSLSLNALTLRPRKS